MQGITHMILFDDNSTDNGIQEIQPWIKSGYVQVVRNYIEPHKELQYNITKDFTFRHLITDRACKQYAIDHQINYFFSVDIDEYLMSYWKGLTLVDAFERAVFDTGRAIFMATKYNYPSTPHILEPIGNSYSLTHDVFI
jgi:hypothetical protein